ncbi:nuclear transport factor 2 family protein [Shewanella sp. KX20019]|uniref:nuclear transport factor 2 family protein n=1 Tax=Shewanella sp. KX20019 TaxID=2803864 RepID=UPI001926A510|nr:nuclear transport factor 2 family protein [Shewanella sp. KX20019]QQX80506.1 nuclear transport factor 2 family protein [Shewanella sp. KX20019]
MKYDTLKQWHSIVNDKDTASLATLLDDNAVFHSPIVHTPQVGKQITLQYLTAALHVLFNDTFKYVREIIGESNAMLEFEVEIEGVIVNGVDIISWNETGKIVDFKVMVRPLKAVNIVHQVMMQQLQNNK